MEKDNFGLELMETRYNGLTEIWVEVECKDDYFTEVLTKTKIEIASKYRSKEDTLERRKGSLKKVREYVSKGEAMVTLVGIGESVYDKRDMYRITNRWLREVELRPLVNNEYAILYTKEVDTQLKATNYIMKVIESVFDYTVEQLEKTETV